MGAMGKTFEQTFSEVYTKFKLHFYKNIFNRFQEREVGLTAVETFCAEVIHALKRPTINEFAQFTDISAQNAAYKVNSLIKKGYIRKTQSKRDKREYYLEVTDKYMNYYRASYGYVAEVMSRVRRRLSPEDIEKLEGLLDVISEELNA